ncbi:unnamed protein product, partial [Pelagomonas calceolata]
LLLLRLVSSFHSNHRPEDLEQTEADEEERAAGERELREGARLALRPARCNIKPEACPRRRRGADRRLIAARMRLVALLAEKCGFIFFDGPARRATPWNALLRCCHRAERPQQCSA